MEHQEQGHALARLQRGRQAEPRGRVEGVPPGAGFRIRRSARKHLRDRGYPQLRGVARCHAGRARRTLCFGGAPKRGYRGSHQRKEARGSTEK